ncbi:MAG: alpha-L-rhamnosidase N-terminal domain-containing protein, partial [Alistipes sp.]|nr:alpha-L-rhamnosidase N-terminal domain-containing protein [Alistipes sp.]
MKKIGLGFLMAIFAIGTTQAQLQDAKWIGTSKTVLYSDYLPIFRYYSTLQLDAKSQSTDASVLLGGNDPRLMNRNLNIQGVENERDGSYIRVEYDIKPMASGKPACIHIYRAGYTTTDNPEKPLQTFEIPAEVVSAEQAYSPLHLQIEGTASTLTLHVNDRTLGQAVVNPHGNSHDFIGYPQLAEIGYAMRAGQKAVLSDVKITHYRTPNGTLYSAEKPISIGGKESQLHLYDPSNGGLPTLRSSFKLKDKEIASATLYATARGIYEAYINGQKVGKEWYAPGVSQYNKTHYYQKYEVDSLLHKGTNHIQVDLAEGWWMGYVTYSMTNWNFFGDQLAFRSRLVVRYNDGDSTVLCTQPQGWEVSVDGPVQYASMFNGQITDSRRKHTKWMKAEELTLDGHLPSEGEGST